MRQLQRRIDDGRFTAPYRSRRSSPDRPYRSRCAGRGEPVIASRHAWRSSRGRSAASVDIGRELGHRRIERPMRDFLIRVAMMEAAAARARSSAITGLWPSHASCKPAARFAAPTDCAKQMPGRPGNARIAIGHVGRRLLRVREHPRDAESAEFDQRPSQHRIDEEHMRRAVRGKRARQPFGAGEPSSSLIPVSPSVLRRAYARACGRGTPASCGGVRRSPRRRRSCRCHVARPGAAADPPTR